MTALTVIGYTCLCMFVGAALWEVVKLNVKPRYRPATGAEKERSRLMAAEAKARSSDVRRTLHKWERSGCDENGKAVYFCVNCHKTTTEAGWEISAELCPGKP